MRDSWEAFLSELCPFIYTMSEQLQQLVPDSKYVMPDDPTNTGISKDDLEIEKLRKKMLNKIIIPIIKKEYKKEPPLSNKKINEFFKYCVQLSEIIRRSNNIHQLAEEDIGVYEQIIEKIKQHSFIDDHIKEESIAIEEIMMDYTEIIVPIVVKRLALLERAIEQIDYKDLIKSLYGSLLSSFCITFLIDTPEFYDQNKFARIAHYGHELAKNLDGYIDTLDILTNPDEDARIRKIK